jgi:hypothetical protein
MFIIMPVTPVLPLKIAIEMVKIDQTLLLNSKPQIHPFEH